MSKVSLNLSYKNCCIVKHTLERSIEMKGVHVECDRFEYENGFGNITEEHLKEDIKELEEEKRALESITEQIENWKERNHIK